MNNIKKVYIVLFFVVITLTLGCLFPAYAQDLFISSGINFLISKQDATGKITQGYSSASQWAAIALSANQIDVNGTLNTGASLKEFLLSDIPQDNASVTDWEIRILAIAAIGEKPNNFGGVNYVENLESFYNNSQIGEIYLLNDDIFGLLALIASGDTVNPQIKQDLVEFIVTHQAENGGFSWSPDTTCQFCDPSADMTAAALQALEEARGNGLVNSGLDNAIAKAKDYLLLNQNLDGGFGYFGTSDADTTSWVLSGLNSSDLKSSQEATDAKNWLILNQLTDGSFLTWSGSDTTTTSYALIALSGNSWILQIFSPSESDPTQSPTSLPTQNPSPIASNIPNQTPTPVPTTQSFTTSPNSSSTSNQTLVDVELDFQPTNTPVDVLGESTKSKDNPTLTSELNTKPIEGFKNFVLPVLIVLIFFLIFKMIELRRKK